MSINSNKGNFKISDINKEIIARNTFDVNANMSSENYEACRPYLASSLFRSMSSNINNGNNDNISSITNNNTNSSTNDTNYSSSSSSSSNIKNDPIIKSIQWKHDKTNTFHRTNNLKVIVSTLQVSLYFTCCFALFCLFIGV
jgi:hypothetical protein